MFGSKPALCIPCVKKANALFSNGWNFLRRFFQALEISGLFFPNPGKFSNLLFQCLEGASPVFPKFGKTEGAFAA
jgi:hypothetical protein